MENEKTEEKTRKKVINLALCFTFHRFLIRCCRGLLHLAARCPTSSTPTRLLLDLGAQVPPPLPPTRLLLDLGAQVPPPPGFS